MNLYHLNSHNMCLFYKLRNTNKCCVCKQALYWFLMTIKNITLNQFHQGHVYTYTQNNKDNDEDLKTSKH